MSGEQMYAPGDPVLVAAEFLGVSASSGLVRVALGDGGTLQTVGLVRAVDVHPVPPTPDPREPHLGLATTQQLLDEITARIDVDHASGGGGLNYTTVGGRPGLEPPGPEEAAAAAPATTDDDRVEAICRAAHDGVWDHMRDDVKAERRVLVAAAVDAHRVAGSPS